MAKQNEVVKEDDDKTQKIFGIILVLLVIISLVVLFIVVIFTSTFSDLLVVMDNEKQVLELKDDYVALLEEESSLKSEVVKLQDPDYVARYAREKYMYTKDGEVILKIIDNEKTDD